MFFVFVLSTTLVFFWSESVFADVSLFLALVTLVVLLFLFSIFPSFLSHFTQWHTMAFGNFEIVLTVGVFGLFGCFAKVWAHHVDRS